MAAVATKELSGDPGEEESPAAGKPKRSIMRLALMAAAALVVCGALGGVSYFFFAAADPDQNTAAPASKPPTFYDLPEVLVNLSNSGTERTQYLKVRIVLELADAELVQQIRPVLPRVMDTFQVFLRELRPTDLEGSAGVFRLKEELTRRVNAAIAPARINAVLFKEMVIQ